MRKFFLLLAIALVVGSFFIGGAIKGAIEKSASHALGTEVTIRGGFVSPLDGAVAISGVKVKNPQGFSDGDIFVLDNIKVELEPASLLGSVVHVRSITISTPSIFYEMQGLNTNILALLGHTVSDAPPAAKGDATNSTSSKKIYIDQLVIRGAELHANISGINSGVVQATLPEISLKNIGTADKPVTTEQATNTITRTLLEQAAKANGKALLKNILKDKLLNADPLKKLF